MSLRNTIRKDALLLAAAMIFLSYVNKAVFTHTHILADGSIIVHAHPYLKHKKKEGKEGVPVSSHHHTPGQYCLLSHHILYFTPPVIGKLLPVREALRCFLLPGPVDLPGCFPASYPIRPPPLTA